MARQAVVGLLAHVDAGKTTLAEAMLFATGAIRSQGRVDHGDAYLDFESIERERGITVFAKQAVVEHKGTRIMLLDAPGHVDFAAEAERTLQVLDLAVLVIGANDGVQGHTKTIWRLLERYGVPTLVFVNKMDLANVGNERLLEQFVRSLDAGCVDYAARAESDVQEQMALTDEVALDELLSAGELSASTEVRLFEQRNVFPCLFGSALRLEGVTELLDALGELAPIRAWPAPFAAQVYKVSHEIRGERVTWLKVTGGTLRAKTVLEGVDQHGQPWSEKADQVRLYQGSRFRVVPEVEAGCVCAVTGLSRTMPGDGLGAQPNASRPVLAAVLEHRVEPQDCDAHEAYEALRVLMEEDPLLAVAWDEESQEVRVRLMGAIQREVLQQTLHARFGLVVEFGPGSILYQETIAEPVVGIGHFEPLRHYAEVHLRLEPGSRGSGVTVESDCSEDVLARNWQRLIATHVLERVHRGVLTGAPLTDVHICIVAGRAHAKHTEGGDFRQATYRAIRQGLMQAQSVLLEPWYRFVLEVPEDRVGRALADLQRMSARFGAPVVRDAMATIEGEAPVATMRDYALDVRAYSGGQGEIFLTFGGYEPCHNAEEVVSEAAYDPEADLPHTPDSVFCSHGAGYTVPWRDVAAHAHVSPDSYAKG